ncbi:MAG: hypothetical protein WA792_04575 [Pseudolabrys sp.]
MHRGINRIVLAGVLLAFGLGLAGCEDGFDMDKLDVFHLNDKKKLPGERKDVFPGGVPGVTQGVPQDLVKGYQAPPETATALPGEESAAEKRAAAIEPAGESKPARKPKPRVARHKPSRITVKPAAQPVAEQPQQQQPQGAPWPAPAQQPPQQASGAQSPWPSTTQQPSSAPWPAAPPPGTFSR